MRVIAAAAAIAVFSIVLRPSEDLIRRPITEDAFYSFTIARNIACGRGMTADGVNPTNGFQPLFTLITVPAFAADDPSRLQPLRLVLVLQWCVFVLTAFILGRIAADAFATGSERRLLFWTTSAAFLTGVLPFLMSMNGLETGLLYLGYAVAWRRYQHEGIDSTRHLITFAAMLGGVVLIRIDAAFFVAALAMALLAERAYPSAARLRRAALLSGVAFAISSPWWLYNLFAFGSLMPTSGRAQLEWIFSAERIGKAFWALTTAAFPFIYLGESRLEGLPTALLRTCVLAGVFILLRRVAAAWSAALPRDAEGFSRRKRTLAFGAVFIAASLMLSVWYALSSMADWFYLRYLSPLMLPATVGFATLLFHLTRKRRHLLQLVVGLALCMLLAFVVLLHRGTGRNLYHDDQLALVRKHVPAGRRVGAYQAGTLGYFREETVNLDGKVNAKALAHQQNIAVLLAEEEITWFCDWYWIAEGAFGGAPAKAGWDEVARSGDFVLLRCQQPD